MSTQEATANYIKSDTLTRVVLFDINQEPFRELHNELKRLSLRGIQTLSVNKEVTLLAKKRAYGEARRARYGSLRVIKYDGLSFRLPRRTQVSMFPYEGTSAGRKYNENYFVIRSVIMYDEARCDRQTRCNITFNLNTGELRIKRLPD